MDQLGEDLKVVWLGQKGYLDAIERAVSNGDVLLLENIGESIDPVLDSLIGRLTIKKGRYWADGIILIKRSSTISYPILIAISSAMILLATILHYTCPLAII